ncbi:hypothetical protein GCM10023165_42040 [Variovorax defluvii]|uniref:Trypsin-like peptidase domain-containing protein n=1 Tax=Variovorax defluvii TaxID=913761 RepID=A0ABP8I6V3_9BURK
MSSGDEHAARCIAELAARHPAAVSLGRYASLAVRIDAPLLRRLRLALLPGTDASAEADLWFSGLSESRGDEGFVLDPQVAVILRDQLARERLGSGGSALDAAWQHTTQMHAGWPEALRLEETLTYLALRPSDGAAEALEEALRPAMIALASGGHRAVEVARWAVRAVPRLPAAARDTDAALALLLASSALIGIGGRAVNPADGRVIPGDLGWLLPASLLDKSTALVCEVGPESLLLRPPGTEDAAGSQVTLPITRPLFAELSWTVDATRVTRVQAIVPGTAMPLPAGWRELRLRTLTGAVYRLGPATAAVAMSLEELLEGCVFVHCGNAMARGLFVSDDRILTTLHAVSEAVREAANPSPIEVRKGTHRSAALLVAADPRVDLALLAVNGPLRSGRTMPRAQAAPEAGQSTTLLVVEESSWTSLAYRVTAFEVSTSASGRTYEGLLEIERDGGNPLPPTKGLSGVPVIHAGEMVGMVALGNERDLLYAVPAGQIDAFLSWALLPDGQEPDVLVAYAPSDSYGKGEELDEVALERVRRSLQVARLRPRVTAEMRRTRDDDDARALNSARAAVCLLTPVANASGSEGHRDMAAMAFRRWVDPGFPVAMLTYRTNVPRLPRPLQAAPTLSLDSLDEETLWLQLQHTLGSRPVDAPTASDADFAAAAHYRLGLSPGEPSEVPLQQRLEAALADAASREGIDRAALVERADMAAMLMLPDGKTLADLRRVARAEPGRRAVYLNAMPVQYARLLLKRAWFPNAPPPHVVIRDQEWPTADEGVDALVTQIVGRVAESADAVAAEMRWVLSRATADYVVVFATRPFPDARIVSGLKASLPGALLFFLGLEQDVAQAAAAAGVTVLPGLQDASESLRWVQNYKRMLEGVAPRGRAGSAPPR